MGASIAGHAQPAPASEDVVPKLLVRTDRVVPEVYCLKEATLHARLIRAWSPSIRVALLGELTRVSLATIRASNAHQCRLGCAPTPFSSMRRPVAKRSSRYV